MRTRRVDVGPSLPCNPVLLSSLQKGEAVLHICHCILTLTLNEDACMFVFPDVQRFVLFPVLEEVIQLVIIDLQE